MSYQDLLTRRLESLKDQARDAIWALSSCLCKPAATVKVNGRNYKLLKVLGEGGFSFVYLAQDAASGREFALKRIRVDNSEGVRGALREVEAYRRFRHPNIIRIFDSAVVEDPSGDGKIVYLFLPLYKRGNLQDAINAHTVNSTHFSEHEMVRIFKGTCEAVRAMHDYRTVVAPNGAGPNLNQAAVAPEEDVDEPEDDHDFPEPDGDAEGGFSYGGGSSVQLVRPPKQGKKKRQGVTAVFDGDEELERLNPQILPEGAKSVSDLPAGTPTEHVPYAHRDIKPGNVMLSDEGIPVLMDFGSTIRARIHIETRQQALTQQDLAAEQSTMTFRAPELFDVKTGVTLDEKVDIWSLGCTLYTLAYLKSPFEAAEQAGGSIAMAALNAQYKHPNTSAYSEGLRGLIDTCLKAEPKERPDIHRLIELTDAVLRTLG